MSKVDKEIEPDSPVIVDNVPINTDIAIQRVGGNHLFQVFAGFTLILIFTLSGQIIYGLSFLQDRKNLMIECRAPGATGFQPGCTQDDACNKDKTEAYRFDTEHGLNNWITEIPEMLCYSSSRMTLTGTMYFIGFLAGSILWLRVTDLVGRKWLVVGGVVLHILTQLIYIIKLNIASLYAATCILGFKAAITNLVTYLLLVEIVSPKFRAVFCALANGFDGGSNAWLPLVYQFGQSFWIIYWINLGLAIFLIFPLIFFIPESPKFLIGQQRFGDARRVYERIAYVNRKPMFIERLEGQDDDEQDDHFDKESNKKKKPGMRELLKNKVLRRPLIIIPIIWLTVDMVYFGINFSLQNLKGSIYVNGYISGGAEIVSYGIAGVMANTLGRKKSIIFCFLVGGLACLFYQLASTGDLAWTYVCVLIGKFGAACTFNMVYLITTEMFPTVFRGTVFGIANIFARLGGILAPIIDGVAEDSFMYIFGALGILSGFCSFLLRETKGEVMSDTLEQQEREQERRIYIRNERMRSMFVHSPHKPLIHQWGKSKLNKSYG